MITIAICDDEAYMLEALGEKTASFFNKAGIEIKIMKYHSGEELLEHQINPDVIFLDIQMQGLNGMDTAKTLRKQGFKGFLIFVTVLQEPVYDAFEVLAFDYLVKPINDARFYHTMKRLLDSLQSNETNHLLVQKGNGKSIIPFGDIVYCEVINRKIYLHLRQQETIDYYDKMENLEQNLDGRFFKCHRSYLINLNFLTSYKDGMAYLSTGDVIPVSRLRKDEFSKAIMHYMKEWRY